MMQPTIQYKVTQGYQPRRMRSCGSNTVMAWQATDKNDIIAFVKQNRVSGEWLIFIKVRQAPYSQAVMYNECFGENPKYPLNRPQKTREDCEKRMKLIAKLRNWEKEEVYG